ncbi:MAG: hypothetical protein MZV65_44465 [Chromatiales bacterium]|nr:hypothetical protein [Chromatiales bacterium]
MLGLFSPKLPHPLADEKERQRVLGELAGADALSALKRSVDWLKTLAESGGMAFPLRSMLIRQIDDVAQRPARIIGREYLTMAHLSDEEDMRLWRASRAFWSQLGATYNACLSDFTRSAERPEDSRAELTRVAVRLIRAYGARLKWDQFRYWPASEALWQNIGRAYLYALDNGFSRREVSAYPGERVQTTVEQEYLQRAGIPRFLHGQSAAVRDRDRRETDLRTFCRASRLPPKRTDGYAYWVDPEQRRAPSRGHGKIEQSLSRFYFTTADGGGAAAGVAADAGAGPPAGRHRPCALSFAPHHPAGGAALGRLLDGSAAASANTTAIRCDRN